MAKTKSKGPDLVPMEAMEAAAECLKVMAHPVRLRMVDILMQGEFPVHEIAELCGVGPHQACEHLRLMQGPRPARQPAAGPDGLLPHRSPRTAGPARLHPRQQCASPTAMATQRRHERNCTDEAIVIVGGVAGGASAAARARRLTEDAEIVLFERGEHISFANCGLPYHIGGAIADRDRLLVQTPEALRKRFRIDVRTRTEVVAHRPRSASRSSSATCATGQRVRPSRTTS